MRKPPDAYSNDKENSRCYSVLLAPTTSLSGGSPNKKILIAQKKPSFHLEIFPFLLQKYV